MRQQPQLQKGQQMSHEDELQKRLKSIKERPEYHQHTYNDLQACCTIEGFLHLQLIDAHQGIIKNRVNYNCDVTLGPCGCGGWH